MKVKLRVDGQSKFSWRDSVSIKEVGREEREEKVNMTDRYLGDRIKRTF